MCELCAVLRATPESEGPDGRSAGVQYHSPQGLPRQPEPPTGRGGRRLGWPGESLGEQARAPSRAPGTLPGEGPPPVRGLGAEPPPACAPQRLRTLPRAPSPPRPAPPAPGPSEAPREEFQPFPLRRAVCGLLAARPQRAREVGAGRRGPVTSRVWQLPGPRCPAQDSRPAAPVPGHQTSRSNSPGLRDAPGSVSLLSSPLPAPRGRSLAFCVSPPALWSPQNLSLKLKLALAASPSGKSVSLSKPRFFHL